VLLNPSKGNKKSTSAKELNENSTKTVQSPKEEYQALLSKLNTSINMIDSGKVDFDSYHKNLGTLLSEVAVFNVWNGFVIKGLSSDSTEAKEKALKLKRQVRKIQIDQFPKMRKAYVESIEHDLWRDNTTIKALGRKKDRLRLIGRMFASNRNKEDCQNKIIDAITSLRFKRVDYLWYDGQDEYTYYKVRSLKDNQLQE